MADQEKLELSYLYENSISDPILLFTNPEGYGKYVEERQRARKEAEMDTPDTRDRLQRIHDTEMARRMDNPPPLVDDYIANFGANQNARRGPTIGVDTEEGSKIQSKEELARLNPLRRTGPKPTKSPLEDKSWM